MISIDPYRRTFRHTHAFRVVAMLLVLLFATGSVRQIIPKVCATQQLAKECVLPKTSGPVLGSCCTTPANGSQDQDVASAQINEEIRITPCAFCTLMTSPTVVSLEAHTVSSPAQAEKMAIRKSSVQLAHEFWLPAARRGPPCAVLLS